MTTPDTCTLRGKNGNEEIHCHKGCCCVLQKRHVVPSLALLPWTRALFLLTPLQEKAAPTTRALISKICTRSALDLGSTSEREAGPSSETRFVMGRNRKESGYPTAPLEEEQEEAEEQTEEGDEEEGEEQTEGSGGEDQAAVEADTPAQEAVEPPKLAEGFFEIEAIRRRRLRKGQLQYLVKWSVTALALPNPFLSPFCNFPVGVALLPP